MHQNCETREGVSQYFFMTLCPPPRHMTKAMRQRLNKFERTRISGKAIKCLRLKIWGGGVRPMRRLVFTSPLDDVSFIRFCVKPSHLSGLFTATAILRARGGEAHRAEAPVRHQGRSGNRVPHPPPPHEGGGVSLGPNSGSLSDFWLKFREFIRFLRFLATISWIFR